MLAALASLPFAALHWSRHEVANALRAMESMRFVEQQVQVAKAIADKAAIQLTYLMESPCLRGVTQPASAVLALAIPACQLHAVRDGGSLLTLRLPGKHTGLTSKEAFGQRSQCAP